MYIHLHKRQFEVVVESMSMSLDTLKEILKTGKTSNPTQILSKVNEISSVLEYIKNQGVIGKIRSVDL